jgi:hypothetical protein
MLLITANYCTHKTYFNVLNKSGPFKLLLLFILCQHSYIKCSEVAWALIVRRLAFNLYLSCKCLQKWRDKTLSIFIKCWAIEVWGQCGCKLYSWHVSFSKYARILHFTFTFYSYPMLNHILLPLSFPISGIIRKITFCNFWKSIIF